MRAQPAVECDSMCAGPVGSPIRASAHAAAAGTLNCSSVRRKSGVRTHSERLGIGGNLQHATQNFHVWRRADHVISIPAME
jgi:hypothetical protein